WRGGDECLHYVERLGVGVTVAGGYAAGIALRARGRLKDATQSAQCSRPGAYQVDRLGVAPEATHGSPCSTVRGLAVNQRLLGACGRCKCQVTEHRRRAARPLLKHPVPKAGALVPSDPEVAIRSCAGRPASGALDHSLAPTAPIGRV